MFSVIVELSVFTITTTYIQLCVPRCKEMLLYCYFLKKQVHTEIKCCISRLEMTIIIEDNFEATWHKKCNSFPTTCSYISFRLCLDNSFVTLYSPAIRPLWLTFHFTIQWTLDQSLHDRCHITAQAVQFAMKVSKKWLVFQIHRVWGIHACLKKSCLLYANKVDMQQ